MSQVAVTGRWGPGSGEVSLTAFLNQIDALLQSHNMQQQPSVRKAVPISICLTKVRRKNSFRNQLKAS